MSQQGQKLCGLIEVHSLEQFVRAKGSGQQVKVCRIHLSNGALLAELAGTEYAPSRLWDREKSPAGDYVFSRHLTAAEAYRSLRFHEVPPDCSGFSLEFAEDLRTLTFFPKVAIPLIIADDHQDRLHLRIALKHPSRAKILEYTIQSDTPPERGYVISEGSITCVEPDSSPTNRRLLS